MGKVLAFALGAVAGAVAAGLYFRAHALSLTLGGVADKVFGEGSTASSVVRSVSSAVEGLQ